MALRNAMCGVLVLGLVGLAGCGAGTTKGTRADGMTGYADGGLYSDWGGGGRMDFGGSGYWDVGGGSFDGGTGGEGGVPTGDGGGGNCGSPIGGSCQSCAANELCTPAGSGTCAARIELRGAADSKEVMVAINLAYVACWKKSPKADTLCATFDTCALTGTVSEQMVKDWICKKAQKTDFPTSADYDEARGLNKCNWLRGQLVYRPNWQIAGLEPGKLGVACLGYDQNPIYKTDRLPVHDCTSFPYP
ncbi:MAG: hypothetical protein IT371_11130 [Deltaproteobacteria bacterium]|nr:hypothetical protein [Deltaproteobacteria bacterium]